MSIVDRIWPPLPKIWIDPTLTPPVIKNEKGNSMSNVTLQAELEQILHNLSGNLREASNEDDYADSISEALKAILATVSKHLPEKKDPKVKHLFSTPNGTQIDCVNEPYIKGYNTAITEMKKTLGADHE